MTGSNTRWKMRPELAQVSIYTVKLYGITFNEHSAKNRYITKTSKKIIWLLLMNPRAKHLKHKSYLVNSLIQSNLCNVTTTDQTVKSTWHHWNYGLLCIQTEIQDMTTQSINPFCKINILKYRMLWNTITDQLLYHWHRAYFWKRKQKLKFTVF